MTFKKVLSVITEISSYAEEPQKYGIIYMVLQKVLHAEYVRRAKNLLKIHTNTISYSNPVPAVAPQSDFT
jgi:hypothetical protein